MDPPNRPTPAAAPANGYQPSALPILDQVGAFANSAVNALPIVGPGLTSIGNNVDAGFNNLLAPVFGFKPETADDRAKLDAGQNAQFPVASGLGTVAGVVAPFAVGGAIPQVSRALGMDASVPLLGRTLASAGSSAALTGFDSLARGSTPQDSLTSAGVGGLLGGLLPGAGAVLGKGTRAIADRVAPAFRALTNSDDAAQRLVAGAAAQDVRSGVPVMSAADEASAATNGQPIINADRFGQNVRGLTRTAANLNQSAKGALTDFTDQRFKTQSTRAVDFVKRITGGTTDDLALQDQMATAARASNKAAYDRAYSAPAAQAVWTPEIKQLFQSPDFLKAVRGATTTGANDAAISGSKAVLNPFQFNADGSIALKRMVDGSVAKPNLQFWDIVQRNLRAGSEKAFRSGDNLQGSQLGQMRSQLLKGLDSAVPQFGSARAGAAAAFGAEDALDAGRKFVSQRMSIPEAQAAYSKFTPAERKAFGTGFASSLIDKIRNARDGVNVIDQTFGSPAARSQVELALGKNAAAQLEHFVRVEDILNMTKNSVSGNSSTASQLAAMGGLGALGGGLVSGWDPKTMLTSGGLMMAGRMGMRTLGKAVDQKVMQRVAEILSSGDKDAINRTVLNATVSGQHANAIKAIEKGLQALGQSEADFAQRPKPAAAY